MTDRASKVGDSEPPPSLTPEQAAPLEASNTLRQYDTLVELIRDAIPERIAVNKRPYYRALEAADKAWFSDCRLDVSEMETLLSTLLAEQLQDVQLRAQGKLVPELPSPPGPAWGSD